MKRKVKERMEELLDQSIKAAKNKDFDGVGFDYSRYRAAYYLEKRIALRKGLPEPTFDPYVTRRGQALIELRQHERQRELEGEYPEAVELFEKPSLLLLG